MKRTTMLRILTGLILIGAGLAANCGRGSDAANTSMMIVYTTGSAFVLPSGKTEIPAQVGMIVREKDMIRTESGTVDLQTRNGSAVRVREMARITISSFTSGDVKLTLDRGGLLASVKKAGQGENFSVNTPTAVAGVRGTTFAVEIGEDQRSSVKVLDGKVAMAPRVAALDKFTDAQIKADPNLSKLAQLSKNETVLEDKTRGEIDPGVEGQLLQTNREAESAQPSATKLAGLVSTVDKSRPVSAEKVDVSVRELIDARTLVTVDPAIMDKAVKGQKEDAAKEIAVGREKATEGVLGQIMDDASKEKLNSEKEIQQRYNRLELIVLKNGDKLRGAVIAQTGQTILVYTPEGVKKIQRPEVEYQEPL